MKESFINKIKNNEYISKLLYENIKRNFPDVIPDNFNLEAYDDAIIEKEYLNNKEYLENMYKGIDDNIHLDKEQIKAILADEDYSLIIAGAGTGKTTTMVSKVKYLVDIKKVDPQKILVMSFSKKAVEELEKRIVLDFEIPVKATTFHSLGLSYVRKIFKDRKCYVVDNNVRNNIFLEYFKERIFPYKNKIKELLDIFSSEELNGNFVFLDFFKENYDKYEDFNSYFEDYKKYKFSQVDDIEQFVKNLVDKKLNQEYIYTIKGDLVKSKGEAIISNFLFCNNIEYKYEKIYKKILDDNKIYKPDFTLDLGGEEVYIEYFGLSTYKDEEKLRYNKIRKIKEDYHKIHHNKFIKIDYYPGENIEETLREELLKMGFALKPKSYEEIYNYMLDNNPSWSFHKFEQFLYNAIDFIKSSKYRDNYKEIISKKINELANPLIARRQAYYINDFYLYYQFKLFGSLDYGFDFSDLIFYANKYINNVNSTKIEYLIIDEYQDISEERYNLIKNIVKINNCKVLAVGDDWQSIYSFSGSKIEYTYDFEKYFEGAKLLKIVNTYRNSQELINYSGNFIMKNEDQIKKQLVSNKELLKPIKFVMFDDPFEYDVLKETILNIHKHNKDHNILILARNNNTIKKCYECPELKDEIGTKIKFVGYEDIDIDGMTIHKSKGLSADEVIVIGLSNNFPDLGHTDFWINELFSNKPPIESIECAEERRLFYVALTRTKNYVYLLVNKNPKYRSPFLNEICNIIKNN